MRIFKINKNLSIVCDSVSTRSGFKHTAILMNGGYQTVFEAKVCYQNRTWERYQFETVLGCLAKKMEASDNFFEEAKTLNKLIDTKFN